MTSIFPNQWKNAKVLPVQKKSSPNIVSDYRPISILPSLSKVCEVLIRGQMNCFMEDNCDLYKNQSGFRKGHSTTTCVLNITEEIRSDLNNKRCSILVLLDFSKAFDYINYEILLQKLKTQFKFSESACRLLNSYLKGRSQTVCVDDHFSKPVLVSSGVPQGSVLGPLLFSMYINDLPACVSFSRVHMYADDVQLVCSSKINEAEQCIESINSDLILIHSWSIKNNLMLNANKTKCIMVSNQTVDVRNKNIILNGVVIPFSTSVNNLGIIMNNRLTWDDHVRHVSNKVYLTLRSLNKVNSFLPTSLRKKLVKSLIVPHFLYGCEIYSRSSSLCAQKLNVCFNSCIRYIFFLGRLDRVSTHRTALLGFELDTLFDIRSLILFFKILKFKCPPYLYKSILFGTSARTCQIRIPIHSSSIMDKSFFVSVIRLWNALPISTRNSSSVAIFRRYCEQFFA